MADKWKTAILWAVAAVLAAATVALIICGKLPLAAALCVAPILGLTVVKAFDNRMLSLSFILLADFAIPVLEHYLPGMSMGMLMDATILFNVCFNKRIQKFKRHHH